ncbi:MAG: tRNA (adenosine(37)-N6)-threonylcarbamoyltransferase complex dimerization subunit type 1 TsaB [Holophagales bacterium]|nr:tRNA (adenosine(37)-N6)-threonylcarbamoyltransferase complex dimerization subunit type 1 TsaB [Holophagales bacterium]MYG31968.1 tRNA (adenosine(37)-N6)-threonylcarbamoyltransferase complex dimerization subunit type 1 TsaB [Holophagales bacterium]MYI79039.1 tRNA (adenosine(37)-N6)-threonylcarbamoyltransferase complex dimerization subunit type 1 TsaB [Holophagales bacterium]
MPSGPLLAFDTGSPVVSVALALPDRVDTLATPQGRSSRELIAMIHELLAGAGLEAHDLEGIGAARGPGSFTGLRVGLATAIGLHQASGVRAGAVSTFEVLASHYAERTAVPARVVLAVVDAHRDRWFTQRVRLGTDGTARSDGPSVITSRADLERSAIPLVGHGVSALELPAGSVEATELAPNLLLRMRNGDFPWGFSSLVEPLYLRPPATSGPKLVRSNQATRKAGERPRREARTE